MDTTLLRAALALIGLALAQALWGCAPHASAADVASVAQAPARRHEVPVPYFGEEFGAAQQQLIDKPDEPVAPTF